jgi:chromosome segregation ATPase
MDWQLIGTIAAAVSAIGGFIVGAAKMREGFKADVLEETTKAIELAKESGRHDMDMLRQDVEQLGKEIAGLDRSFQKEIVFIKDTYNGEIRNLSQKIDELREEIKSSNASLIELLGKLLDR